MRNLIDQRNIIFKWKHNINYVINTSNCPYLSKSIFQNIYYHDSDLFNKYIKNSLLFWSESIKIKYNLIENINNLNQTHLIFSFNNLNPNTLATCQNSYNYPNDIIYSKVETNNRKCFHQNIKTCQIINKYLYFLNDNNIWVILIIISGFTFLFLIIILIDKYRCRYNSYLNSKLYILFYFTSLYIYIFNIRKCFNCYGFTKIMIHEIGHSLGLGHSNSSNQSIMAPIYDFNNLDCIYYEDFKLLNNVYQLKHTKDNCLLEEDLDYFFIQDCLFILLILIIMWYLYNHINNYITFLKSWRYSRRVRIDDSHNLKDTIS